MSVLLEAKGLSAGYGPLAIIRDIDIRVPQQQLTVMVAPTAPARPP